MIWKRKKHVLIGRGLLQEQHYRSDDVCEFLGSHGCRTNCNGYIYGSIVSIETLQRFSKMVGLVEHVGSGPWKRLRKRK